MTSAANTVSLEVDVANVPLVAPQLLFFSPGTAQSQLDSFGGSTAYAGAPFVGQTLEGVGGLVSGLGTGVFPPIPKSLPGYVQTSNPSNHTANDSQGPYTLNADSEANSSTATAGIAASSGQPALISSTATATSKIDTNTGALTDTATSITQPFAIGGLLQVGTIQATASMGVDPSGHLNQASSLDLVSMTIAGIPIGLTQNGLQVLGSTLLTPSLAALNTLLSSAGISLALLPVTRTAKSITSEGLQITLTKNLAVEGATAVIITIGQANAQLQYGLVTTPPTTTPATPITPLGTGTDTAPTIPDATGTGPIGSINPSTNTPTATANPTTAQTAPGVTNVRPTLANLAARLGPDALRWYLILAAAALALTLASRAAGHFAVRRTTRGVKGSP
jgi:hypothetical protein